MNKKLIIERLKEISMEIADTLDKIENLHYTLDDLRGEQERLRLKVMADEF